MKKIYILPALLLTANMAFTQTIENVAKFSMTSNLGSARSAAMGGAFGALGGDLSAASGNPAGIGVFRRSEVSITPALNFGKTTSGSRTADDVSFQMGNMGGVVALYNSGFDWKSFNFAINYTNLNNFNSHSNQYVGNSNTSLLQIFADQAYGYTGDELWDFSQPYGNTPFALAYQTALILPNETDPNIYDPWYGYGVNTNQRKLIKEDGYQGEYSFAFGTNYKDKLYLGLSVGIQSLHYRFKSVYTETEDAIGGAATSDLNYYDFKEYQKVNGVGTNFKIGAIYRPIPELRIGAAIHTPTYYSITDKYYNGINSSFKTPDEDGYTDYSSFTDPSSFDYDLRTPWKAIVSLATVLQGKTIISFDYEYVNYSSAKLSSDDYDYYNPEGDGVNDFIKSDMRATHNFRAGAEYRINSTFSLRGGYGLQAGPFGHTKETYKIQTASGGFGLNFGPVYCDAAYIFRTTKDQTQFYSYGDIIAQPVKNKYTDNEARITVGVRF